MFWKTNKKFTPVKPAPHFEYPVNTIRVWQCPDAKWRCQSYGMYIPAGPTMMNGKPGSAAYYLPCWCTLSMPPGNEAGFDSEDAAIVAWHAYSERKEQPGTIIFTPAETKICTLTRSTGDAS